MVKRRIRGLNHSVNTRSESIFIDPDSVRELSRLHENFVIVPADKASNNYTFVCKRHYVDILIEELGLHSFLETLHTIWPIFLHQRCWTTTNRSSPPSEYSQIVRSSICLTFIGFRRCTKIHIIKDSLRVHRSVRPSLSPFYSQNCLHILKLYCRYLYTWPCMINHIWGLKQLWLQVNGHGWFHLQRLCWPVRNGVGAKNSKWKYMFPAGFEPTTRQSTTGKLQRLRPLGHEGLMVISG